MSIVGLPDKFNSALLVVYDKPAALLNISTELTVNCTLEVVPKRKALLCLVAAVPVSAVFATKTRIFCSAFAVVLSLVVVEEYVASVPS